MKREIINNNCHQDYVRRIFVYNYHNEVSNVGYNETWPVGDNGYCVAIFKIKIKTA